MSALRSKILENTYYVARSFRWVGQVFGLTPADQLRVLIYHDIGPYDHKRFEEQLRWLSQRWNFVTPTQFEAMVSGQEKIKGRNLLVTFDDGFSSNRIVAENILNGMGIKAVFFIVSDFAAMENKEEALAFSAKNISNNPPIPVPRHWDNMKWPDLSRLLEQGHTIGAHTKSHARLSSINSRDQLVAEICDSADIIAAKLGIDVDHFSYTFGDINSINEEALCIAARRFRYVYSGIRGNNIGNSTHAIYRDAAASQDAQLNYLVYPNRLLGTFLEGAADPYYTSWRKRLAQWAECAQTDNV